MSRRAWLWLRYLVVVSFLSATTSSLALGQKAETPWDVTQPHGQTREIDFTTSEGTWMSVDISPDGHWIVFDLLDHIYRVPATGGDAQCLTQDSGIALNFQPRFSPDGNYIAFISDRRGQNNLWLMDADGKNPRPVFIDKDVRVLEPAWTPDGQYIIVQRQNLRDASMLFINAAIWMYHRDGGEGVELLGKDANAFWPSVSPDGKYVYFHVGLCPGLPAFGQMDPTKGCFQVRRLELRTGQIVDITSGMADWPTLRGSSGGAIAPQISPDGRWLAFARRIPDGTISYKGHKFSPRNALWLHDLRTGAERVIMDPIELDIAEHFAQLPVLPSYSWARDAQSLVIAQGGKIRRVWVESGEVETIPFTARVHRVISQMAYRPFRISDGPFEARFIRWPTASPDGRKLVFQAVGKLWIMDLPSGTPRRLTAESFKSFEFSPAWSRDGQWIAFTSWDDKERGQLWKVAAAGGQPQRLTTEAGEYIHPVWSPDGTQIVVARGAGMTAQGRGLAANPWYDLVRLPAGGGEAEAVARVNAPGRNSQIVAASFGPEARLYYPEPICAAGRQR